MAYGEQHRTLSTIENASQILEVLRETDGATLTEVAAEVDLAVSTLHDYLYTLEELEYVVAEEGEYKIGMRFYELGEYVKRSDDLLNKVRSVLEEVATQTEEAVWYLVEEHGKAVFIENRLGDRAVPTHSRAGERVPIHTVAGGKVILAHYPEAKVADILETQRLTERTENTLTDRDELFEELRQIKEHGIAFNDEESADGVRAVAAPVFQDGAVAGAISVPGPANRLVGDRWEKEIPEVLLSATNELDLRYRYSE